MLFIVNSTSSFFIVYAGLSDLLIMKAKTKQTILLGNA